MTILKIKETSKENSYTIFFENGGMLDGVHEELGSYQQVLDYIEAGNTIEPQFTAEELEQNAQNKINAEAQNYLKKTDWYVLRFADNGKPIPQEIKDKRQQARESIV